ncbi:hypothetical protein ACMU_18850 [Actibacterium mucosum KCTC 23349]|uniref:Major facilitator superfamily (MFS) profile domain-containing protein n=1 Tax=Actibacterium mucosum KCTC 23349 TaxID=1454373 RepID=A0A037ZF98_9RHOB|nr:MFS transporter [Actibacterium mucosum]KAJ54283.1 hypothetical protein ACMU_18850 [Actibacterium mucosum KCTC 23349]
MLRFDKDYWPAIGLGLSQIIGYGTLMYAYAILLPHMAEDLGLSLSGIFGVMSLALFFGGFMAPVSGMLTDRYGGRFVMTIGTVVAGVALIGLSKVTNQYNLFALILIAEAAGMCVLYQVAFASVVRLDLRVPSQRLISIITLFGGVASTIFWPLTLWLYNGIGWQETWLVLGVFLILTCVPLNFFSLRGPQIDPRNPPKAQQSEWPELSGPARRKGMLWMIVSFLFSGYLMGGVMTLWVTNVQDLGHTAAMAALAGAVIGPFKTVGRFLELLVSRNLYPLNTYALSMALMLSGFVTLIVLGFTVPGLMIAAALYGMGDGIKTIARGTLPLALFGRKGYGARLGWINTATMALNASAPFAFAWLTQTLGGQASFTAMAVVISLAFLAYLFIPDPRRPVHETA